MKQIILLVIISLTLAPPGLQVKTPAAQPSSPGWYIVFEEKFTSSNRAQFMKEQREVVDMWRIHNPDVPVYAWQNDDNSLSRLIPILSFASIDTLYRKMGQISAYSKAISQGVENKPVNQSTVSGTVMVWVPELSHHKVVDFSEFSEKPYTEWMFVYLHSGQEQTAVEALQRFRDYYIDNSLNYPWDTFRVLFGNETPVMIGMFRAESPAALQAKGKRIWEKHGDKLGTLWDEVVQHTWKIETKSGWFNQSLSNIPIISPDEEIVESE